MKRRMFSVLAIVGLCGSMVPSCGATKLPACLSTQLRMWCRCQVVQTTVDRVMAGKPPSCTVPFATTMCVDAQYFSNTTGAIVPPGTSNSSRSGVSSGAISAFLSAVRTKIESVYSGPLGPFLVKPDGTVYGVDCPLMPESGGPGAQCYTNGQTINPWPGTPVADLDVANPLSAGILPQGAPLGAPRIEPQGLGGQSIGFGGGLSGIGGGVPTDGADCSACLAEAPCDGLTMQECTTMHCAAVCPWDDNTAAQCSDLPANFNSDCAPSGSGCDMTNDTGCCPGTYCTPSDVGASCM